MVKIAAMRYKKNHFGAFSKATSQLTGHPYTFILAGLIILIWAITGPVFHFSNTWQLVINTGTTIITFLMVFLIQNTQNRDTLALQLKLDELIRAMEGAHNSLLDIEELTEEELAKLKKRYSELSKQALEDIRKGKDDTGRVDIKKEIDPTPFASHKHTVKK